MDNGLVIFIVSLLSAILGAMGVGGGGILLIYLTAFASVPQLQAQGINLIFFLPVAAIALIIHSKNKLVRWRVTLQSVIPGIIGVLLGSTIAHNIDASLLSKLFAVLLVIIGLKETFHKKDTSMPSTEKKTGG